MLTTWWCRSLRWASPNSIVARRRTPRGQRTRSCRSGATRRGSGVRTSERTHGVGARSRTIERRRPDRGRRQPLSRGRSARRGHSRGFSPSRLTLLDWLVVDRTFVIIKPDGVRGAWWARSSSASKTNNCGWWRPTCAPLTGSRRAPLRPSTWASLFYDPLGPSITAAPRCCSLSRAQKGRARSCARSWGRPIQGRRTGHDSRDLATITKENLIHGSDSPESVERENRYFLSPFGLDKTFFHFCVILA